MPIILAPWEAEIGRIRIQGQPARATNSWAHWFMPVIPSQQEAETGRIEVPGQPGQRKFVRPSLIGKEAANFKVLHNRKEIRLAFRREITVLRASVLLIFCVIIFCSYP
jgi:hypothetical protein